MTSPCLVAIIVTMSLAGAAWAESGAGTSIVIPLHPRVPTLLRLPEAAEDVWIAHRGEIQVARSGTMIYVRPRPGTPAGVEGLLEVETATMRLAFRLRVVEHARDAREEVVILAVGPEQDAEGAAPATAPASSAELTPGAESALGAGQAALGVEGAAPAETGAAANESTSASASAAESAPAPTLPSADHDTAMENERDAAADRKSDDEAIRPPRFELSIHAVIALAGVTAVNVPGYAPDEGRRSHRSIGLGFAISPRDAWWAVEANIGAEWLDAPTIHLLDLEDDMGQLQQRLERAVSGPRLQADVGIRAGVGTRWRATACAGFGLQAHVRHIELTSIVEEVREPLSSIEDMPVGAVLALGMGLQRQVGDVLLGIDFQLRQGVPAEYRSVGALLFVAFVLDQGD